jgi:hypothetical protein
VDQTQHNTAIIDEMLQLAQHNAAMTVETLCLHEETAQLCADLLTHPSNDDFAALQAQVTNLTTCYGSCSEAGTRMIGGLE